MADTQVPPAPPPPPIPGEIPSVINGVADSVDTAGGGSSGGGGMIDSTIIINGYPEENHRQEEGSASITFDEPDRTTNRSSDYIIESEHGLARSSSATPAPRTGPLPAPPTQPPPAPPLHYTGQRQDMVDLEPRIKVRGTVLPRHIPLAKCRVLYLGSAEPGSSNDGLQAMQPALQDRYRIDTGGELQGVDAWLTAYSTGLHMMYVAEPKMSAWFPIHTLCIAAAAKCVVMVNGATGERQPHFAPLDSLLADQSDHPPLFTCIMRSQEGSDALECHTFICKSRTAAMALVQSCTHAYEHREGWTYGPPPSDDEENKPPKVVSQKNYYNTTQVISRKPERDVPIEFYQAPPIQGYFYTTNRNLVKNHRVYTAQGVGRSASLPATMERRMVPVQNTLPPQRPVPPPIMPFRTMGPMTMKYPGHHHHKHDKSHKKSHKSHKSHKSTKSKKKKVPTATLR